MDDELERLRKQVEELTALVNLHSQRAMDYAGAFMRNKREWQGLTRKQILEIWCKPKNFNDPMRFARAIESKLKEKNT